MGHIDYELLRFAYQHHADQDANPPVRHPIVIVGAGPVGLSLAIDLAQNGQAVVLLDDDDRLSGGSRAVCYAKRTLEVFDRLGCGQRMVDKGVSWNLGKVFVGEQMLYEFNLQPQPHHERPAFINLQQFYLEGYLTERALSLPAISYRWRNKVVGIQSFADHARLTIETPDGPYELEASHVVAADGARSPIRKALGLESKGRTFQDRFLIADIRMKHDGPAERWFWFDPPFHRGQTVLLHRQADDVWRVDFQLGWDADPEEEKKPERIAPRIKAMLGEDRQWELVWASVYTFACMRMEKFIHQRVIFAGDAAHGVSPFGARGANSGVQDADNLAWKLRAVVQGHAPLRLLDSYCEEREFAANENIKNSTRSSDFLISNTPASQLFRNAVFKLSTHEPFARTLINSGRLSTATPCLFSSLNSPDTDAAKFNGGVVPGGNALDAPVGDQWFLRLLGNSFVLVVWDHNAADLARQLHEAAMPIRVINLSVSDQVLAHRYSVVAGSAYLFRPDQHVCARWYQLPTQAARHVLLAQAKALAQTEAMVEDRVM
jgi:3-(3-hydroxy-phenyl)propionate hydroxylase